MPRAGACHRQGGQQGGQGQPEHAGLEAALPAGGSVSGCVGGVEVAGPMKLESGEGSAALSYLGLLIMCKSGQVA